MSGGVTLNGYRVGPGELWDVRALPALGPTSYDGQRAQLPGRHGVVALGGDLADASMLEVEVWHKHGTAATVEQARRELAAAYAPQDVDGTLLELTIEQATGDVVVLGRPQPPRWSLADAAWGVAAALIQFEQCDPLIYKALTKSVTAGAGGTSGGVTTPLTTPVTTTGSGSTGDRAVQNDGTAPVSRWVVALTGGSAGTVGPQLRLGGETVTIDGTIPAGVTAIVNADTASIEVGDVAMPWISPTSVWWAIPPGPSTFSFRAVSGDGTAQLIWRDADH